MREVSAVPLCPTTLWCSQRSSHPHIISENSALKISATILQFENIPISAATCARAGCAIVELTIESTQELAAQLNTHYITTSTASGSEWRDLTLRQMGVQELLISREWVHIR